MRKRWPRMSCLLVAPILLLSAGCATTWWNGFLDPTQWGNFHENTVSEIQQTISFRDNPGGVPGATDPTPEDLVQTVEEYQIGVGDQLSMRVLDFLQKDVESEFTPTVDELGYIVLPQLGWIHVEGMTARELRAEIIQRARDVGLFPPEGPEPTVVITFILQQQRVYHISGSVTAPGRYRIIPPDFRIREAINQAGSIDPSAKSIYVYRNMPKPKRVIDRGVHATSPPMTPPQTQPPAPPVSPATLSEMAGGPAAPTAPAPAPTTNTARPQPSNPAPPPPAAPKQPPVALPNEQEILETVAPAPQTQAAPAPTFPAPDAPRTAQEGAETAPPPPSTQMAPFIFVNNGWVQGTTTQPAAQARPGPETTAVVTTAPASQPVDWQALAAEGQQRVIRIPADKLRYGDPNYNIVIKPEDWIYVDPGYVGVFYVYGHVTRPGTFSLTGQEITLRQAIASAGGPDPLAWPSRCEVTRRIDGDREETTQWDLDRIMAGKDPDFYIKPEDLINIGTHPVAPLLLTIRNSFRLTYGFGFVYDRNFADIDSYSSQVNPNDRYRARRQARFPGLFP